MLQKNRNLTCVYQGQCRMDRLSMLRLTSLKRTTGQFHVLVIVADGQVTRGLDMPEGELNQQEKTTIDAIVNASSYAFTIVLIDVGYGPWEDMRKFDDKISKREFDNFQIMKRDSPQSAKETAFALAALMKIPFQSQASIELGLLGKTTGLAKKINPRPPHIPFTPPVRTGQPSYDSNQQTQNCLNCLNNRKDVAFGCGHMVSLRASSRRDIFSGSRSRNLLWGCFITNGNF